MRFSVIGGELRSFDLDALSALFEDHGHGPLGTGREVARQDMAFPEVVRMRCPF
ncbi:hypothetical protein [Stenotrophomonas sp. ZAC14D2_NAIMI4_7]|uniref:hypothetical protein n=1 Tax=Stenotrophomonas sp. ZAC14D2_NAIMI4_7 TaxID=2072405 RepID=UPI00131F153D|nr:hypothetical protein [Stenotrophomonas sp. ZAC14D2_NAIMI4_7]